MLRNLERISRENYEIFVCRKMPKTLDMTRILREQKEPLRAGFQDRLVMTASITLRVDYLIVLFLCFFSPLEFSIEIISGKYFTVLKTACFEPLSEVYVAMIACRSSIIARLSDISRPPRYDRFDNPPCDSTERFEKRLGVSRIRFVVHRRSRYNPPC